MAGAGFGTARVYDARTGALVREYQLATPPGTFINDVVVTKDAAYFTDSQRPVLYRIALSGNGDPGAVTTIQLGGQYVHVPGQFNLNGIVATPNGKQLIAVQSFSKKLLPDRPGHGCGDDDRHGSYDLENGDGLLLQGKTLYVVQNRSNKVAVFQLSPDLTQATFVRAITDADFDVPTTIDRSGERLYVVNARFGDRDADRPELRRRQGGLTQLNVTSAPSMLDAPARHALRAAPAASWGQPSSPNRPSVTTASAFPSQR